MFLEDYIKFQTIKIFKIKCISGNDTEQSTKTYNLNTCKKVLITSILSGFFKSIYNKNFGFVQQKCFYRLQKG